MTAPARLAPVALFAYKRPAHLRRCLDALKSNPEAKDTTLIVFSDGPNREVDMSAVREVREVLSQVGGFAGVEVHKRETNVGLARSIIDGVTRVVAEHGRVIVLEDDLIVSPSFLRYMNCGLDLYENQVEVASIHAYVYPVTEQLPETFFLRGADCWGWATWDRAWRHFEPDGAKLLEELRRRGLECQFDLDGSYPYVQMLRGQIAGTNDSWAIRWHASTFLGDMLTLYPGQSLVQNIGNDDSGTHSGATDRYVVRVADEAPQLERIPLVESAKAREAIKRFLRGSSAKPSLRERIAAPVQRALSWLR